MSYLRTLFDHQVPVWHVPLALVGVHILIYLYIYWFRQSIISMAGLALTVYFLFKLVRPTLEANKAKCELMNEESCKQLYVTLYIALNKVTEYFRSIIQLKGGMKAVGKVALFMYASLATKFVGDRVIVYILILGFFAYTPISKRLGSKEKQAEDDKKAEEIKNSIFANILSKIPKYSDLQKKKE